MGDLARGLAEANESVTAGERDERRIRTCWEVKRKREREGGSEIERENIEMAEDESCESRKFLPLVFLQTSRSLGGIRRKGGRQEGGRETRGGTGRLNLPGEFMTELFKGCLVVLNP